MTKEDYINIKSKEPMQIVYEFYKEKFDPKKHSPFISQNEFFHYIQLSYDLNNLYYKVSNYYDNYYGVMTIFNKDGQIIKYI